MSVLLAAVRAHRAGDRLEVARLGAELTGAELDLWVRYRLLQVRMPGRAQLLELWLAEVRELCGAAEVTNLVRELDGRAPLTLVGAA